jgi:hypothetical protein
VWNSRVLEWVEGEKSWQLIVIPARVGKIEREE